MFGLVLESTTRAGKLPSDEQISAANPVVESRTMIQRRNRLSSLEASRPLSNGRGARQTGLIGRWSNTIDDAGWSVQTSNHSPAFLFDSQERMIARQFYSCKPIVKSVERIVHMNTSAAIAHHHRHGAGPPLERSKLETPLNLATWDATQTTTHSLVAALHEVIHFLRNGLDRASMTGAYPQPRKSRSGGLKNTFRRLFGRKSAKDRISLPASAGYPRHFITSAVDIAKQRSASAPNQTVVLRSSALNSHSPFPVSLPNVAPVTDSAIPPRPERSPPPRPDRPRGASVPSVSLNAEEGVDWGDQVPGLGLHDTHDKRVDRASIGFAITSGSNPKRRSRSTDDLRHVPKEHRMSPIQWRQWRRRSDEIRYWRESADEDAPGFTAPESRQPSPERTLARRQGFVERTPPLPEQREHSPTPPPPNAGEFNFGLASGAMQSQEHITLEERLVTLEIKLIDFEYAISKLQADIQTVDVKSPTEDISQHYEASPQPPSNPIFLQPPPKPALENSPTSNYDQSPESTPGMQQMPFGIHHPANQPKPRPTSIATTLKPARGDRSSRNSMTELTIEHYTTLITLIRREQSARIHLEDQVSDLQRQIHSLQSPSPSSLRDIRDARRRPQYSSPASHSGRFDSIDDSGRHYTPPEEKRRPFSRDSNERFLTRQQQRHRYQDDGSRSRSNYNDETDTDDETYHDVYVTPVERGEFERRDLDGPEGLAF
ncbi:MAG: hypothetical protein Q9197_003541 [Variospora fuerteventurae]